MRKTLNTIAGALASAARQITHTKRRARADALTLAGGALSAAGIALIYLPAGLIAAGIALTTFGLLVVDVGES